MKFKLALILIIIVTIIAAVWYLRYGGVTHEQIVDTVDNRAEEIMHHVDARSAKLEDKLDRIESKLDRLLKIAERPLPDGMREAK